MPVKATYNSNRNAVIIDFSGRVTAAESEQFLLDIQNILPKCSQGFKILTDFSAIQMMEPEAKESVKKLMDFFNEQGVSEIFRVIPDVSKDIGFSIMSVFHYSKEVRFITLQSRAEAEARL